MDIIFLGHNGWLISTEQTKILIDPLLLHYFGNCRYHNFYVHPKRKIHLNQLPHIDYVVISHEHSDHFHLDSLKILNKDTTAIFGPLAPNFMIELANKVGLKSMRVTYDEVYELNNLYARFFPSSNDTVFWEQRVIQFVFSEKKTFKNSVFFAVDALLSKEYISELTTSKFPPPVAICVSNNSVITAPDEYSPMDNILDKSINNKRGAIGLNILKEILIDYINLLNVTPNVVIAGGGILGGFDQRPLEPFGYQNQIAGIANKLKLNQKIFGPKPGTKYIIGESLVEESTVEWIVGANDSSLRREEPKKVFLPDIEIQITRIEKELNELVKPLLLSEIGTVCFRIGKFHSQYVSDSKILFRFFYQPTQEYFDYGLNFFKSKFEIMTNPIIEQFPYGIEFDLTDFYLMLEGEIQLWNMAGRSMRNWFPNNKVESLLSFAYSYYGEQVKPDLAFSVWNKSISET